MSAYADRLRDVADRTPTRARMPAGLRPLWLSSMSAWQENGRKGSDARAKADRLAGELADCRTHVGNLERELQMRWGCDFGSLKGKRRRESKKDHFSFARGCFIA
jgi:hypothetical protein